MFCFQDKAENFVQAALFCASEEGNLEGLRNLTEMAQKIDLHTANRVGNPHIPNWSPLSRF